MKKVPRQAQLPIEEAIEEPEEAEEQDEGEEQEDGAVGGMAGMDRIEAKYRARATSPLRAIRAFCVICMGCQPKVVAQCSAPTCPLYHYRMGKNPYQKRGG